MESSVQTAPDPEPTGRAPLLAGALTLLLPLAWLLAAVLAATPAPVAEGEVWAELVAEAGLELIEPDLLAEGSPGEPAPEAAPLAPPGPALPAPPPPAAPPSLAGALPRWERGQQVNVLLLGLDRRSPQDLPRTDTVVLASFDLTARRGLLLSIPRDLVVNIPNYGPDRINTAYPVGEQYRLPGGGIKLVRETVERNFGLPIHHHVLVDFDCFRGVIDAAGGVRVEVPRRIVDPRYPTPDYGYKTVVFEPGVAWLDGDRALEYVRTRYGDTDFGRMRRQQQVIAAFREQAVRVGSLASLPQAINACRGMASDLNVIELVALGASLRDIRSSDVAFRTIDEQLAYPTIVASGASVLMPRWDAIRAMLRSSAPVTTTAAAAP